MIIYNLHTDGDNWRITKFDDGNPASSYLVSHTACQCPAGERSTCRHRQMLPVMLSAGLANQPWFLDWDNSRQVVDFQGNAIPKQALAQAKEGSEDRPALVAEEDCPGHAASYDDKKVCRYCGVHIDSLRPDDDEGPHSTTVSAPDFDSGDGGSNPPAAANPYAPLHAGEPLIDIQGPLLNQFIVVENDERAEGIAPMKPATWRRI